MNNTNLQAQNEKYQEYIEWNRNRLVGEMGLSQSAIIEIPSLYFDDGGRASAYFPGMINMQVVNKHLAIPKPFGPNIDGQCIFEKITKFRMERLGLQCHFVDTYDGYFQFNGEIHCGTNVVREPFKDGWWTIVPAAPVPSPIIS